MSGKNDKKAELAHKLKYMIIERLELEDINPEEIPDDSPIFGEGLGLDSLAALDLVILLEKEFNIKIQDPAQARKILSTIDTLAEYILSHGSD
ncbi:acyl carrier protein [Candidatus Aerophobetes bacterium]|nr:acyl carrier protein [Candidatus Aerophobetes bacterium]